MIEHRLTKRLTDYWDRLREKQPIPTINVFSMNMQSIEDLWQRCFKVSVIVESGSPVYTYDFIGKDLEEIFGKTLEGRKVKEKLGFMPARKMMEQMDKSIKNPFPITIEGQFIDEKNRVIQYRSCLLPFGQSKENITHFVIGVSWKAS
jgi:hypothetical protein